LLGRFRVFVGQDLVSPDAWRNRRSADLIKLLPLSPGHSLHREQIMEALWPNLAPGAASSNLRKAIHFARRAMRSDRGVVQEGAMLSLWPSVDTTPGPRIPGGAFARETSRR
jgi:DNA-binding SARP family transcriptional activator